MASRASLNKVLLIGNLTRDPELRYTPQGNAVCTFGLATNRSWQPADGGERKEETEFHRVVSWNKLAELCSQLLVKGRKVYVEGRLQTRQWQAPDGAQRQVTEIVIDDMRILDSKRPDEKVGEIGELSGLEEIPPAEEAAHPVEVATVEEKPSPTGKKAKTSAGKKEEKEEKAVEDEDDILKDLPF
jgi:single-strand DNA-binding protein